MALQLALSKISEIMSMRINALAKQTMISHAHLLKLDIQTPISQKVVLIDQIVTSIIAKFRVILKDFQNAYHMVFNQIEAEVFKLLPKQESPPEKKQVQLFQPMVQKIQKRPVISTVHNQSNNIKQLSFNKFQDFLLFVHKVSKVEQLNLDFSSFGITDNGCPHLATTLKKYQSVKHLSMNLSFNSITQSGIKQISQSLMTLQNLVYLKLNLIKNSIKTIGEGYLMKHIATLPNLRELYLDLSGNFINKAGFIDLGLNLVGLRSLKKLTLIVYENNLQDQGMIGFIKSINKTNLDYLVIDLRLNHISQYLIVQLKKYGKNKKIKNFDVIL